MLSDNEMKIISHLRQNSRQSLIEIARKTDIPMSTIYDKIKGHEGTTIKKFTSIVDFPAMGFNIRAAVFSKGKERKLNDFLMSSPHINSLFRLGGNYEYYADCIFRYMGEMNDFIEKLEELSIKTEVYFVTQELRREDFLNPVRIEKTSKEGK